MKVSLKQLRILGLALPLVLLSHSCKERQSGQRLKGSNSAESNSFSDNDVSGLSDAEKQELAEALNDRRDMAAAFNNDFNSVMSRILRSERNESYLKILKNYYQGNLIGTFTREEYQSFEATWNTMRSMRDQITKNERRIQELMVGKVDGPALSKLMQPYNFRLRVVLKAMEPGLNKDYSQVLIEDTGEFFNYVSDTTSAKTAAAFAYANEVLNSMYPPSQEIYEKNAAGIRDVRKFALNEFLPNLNGIAADIVGGLPESMQADAAMQLTNAAVKGQVEKFWKEDIDKLLAHYNPGSSGLQLADSKTQNAAMKTFNWLASLPFKGFSFNAGALGVFSTGVKIFYGQYTKRYRYIGNGNLEFCTNWSAKVGAGVGLGKYIGIPFGLGFQWDYEMFEKGSVLSKISHFALIKTLTGVDSGLDIGVGFDMGLKIPLLPGVIGNAYYSPTGDIIGGDVQGLWLPGLGKTVFTGASAQIHSNLTCANRGTHWEHWAWIKNKAKEKWNESGDWVKDKFKENVPNWSSALGLNKITVGDIIESQQKSN